MSVEGLSGGGSEEPRREKLSMKFSAGGASEEVTVASSRSDTQNRGSEEPPQGSRFKDKLLGKGPVKKHPQRAPRSHPWEVFGGRNPPWFLRRGAALGDTREQVPH